MTPTLDLDCYGLAEAQDHFSAVTAKANSTGRPFVVLKGGKPWVEVRPLAVGGTTGAGITITPTRRNVPVADLDALFAGYDGDFSPTEDGFAASAGHEAI